MLTAAAVRTAIYLHGLGVAILFFLHARVLTLLIFLKLDITPDPVLLSNTAGSFTAVAAVSSHCLQRISKRFPVLF